MGILIAIVTTIRTGIFTCFLTQRSVADSRLLEHTNFTLPAETALHVTLARSHKDDLTSAIIFNATK